MKLNFDGYEIEIKAKSKYSAKCNKEDAMHILNVISIYAGEAAVRYEKIGMNALARKAREPANSTYDVLDAAGAYKNL